MSRLKAEQDRVREIHRRNYEAAIKNGQIPIPVRTYLAPRCHTYLRISCQFFDSPVLAYPRTSQTRNSWLKPDRVLHRAYPSSNSKLSTSLRTFPDPECRCLQNLWRPTNLAFRYPLPSGQATAIPPLKRCNLERLRFRLRTLDKDKSRIRRSYCRTGPTRQTCLPPSMFRLGRHPTPVRSSLTCRAGPLTINKAETPSYSSS